MDDIQRKLRKTILQLSYMCQDGNLQSAFSSVDLIWTLYDKTMQWTPETAANEDRDIFIISKGQATLSLYAVLLEKGMFTFDEMTDIGTFDSRFCIQADRTKFPEGGIENSAGSLGHGLPFAVGIAYAKKVRKLKSRVYVLVGDGEFCEGTMWESCLFAASKELDNLCILVDDNDSAGVMINMESLKDKLESFGFYVDETEGHDLKAIEHILSRDMIHGKPGAIIAHTMRGYGSKTLTEHDIWFHKSPNTEELQMLSREIDSFQNQKTEICC